MNNRRLTQLLAGLLIAGCDAEHNRRLGTLSEQPVFPNRPPKAAPRPQPLPPRDLVYDHPLYRYPPQLDPNAPMRNPEVSARLLEEVAPEHTELSRRARVAGIVILELVIDTDGKV